MSETVLTTIENGVGVVTLNRPDRRNAWVPEMEVDYFDALDRCAVDPDVRVVVVTGSGSTFCSGADTEWLASLSSTQERPDKTYRTRRLTHARSLGKPVIAAINGACAGIGFVQAVACDIRFAAAGAKLVPAFSRRGLAPEGGVTWLLSRLIGQGRTAELLLSSQTVLAEEALDLGLVSRVFPAAELMDQTLAYATDLAQNCSPMSMAAVKDHLLADWSQTLDEADDQFEPRMADPDQQADYREGVASFVERRDPAFPPLPANRGHNLARHSS